MAVMRILQLKEEYGDFSFESYASIMRMMDEHKASGEGKKVPFSINRSMYDCIWTESVGDTEEETLSQFLERQFTRFNIDRPEGFYGHSLSISDVIELGEGNEKRAFFVDTIGFKELEAWEKIA